MATEVVMPQMGESIAEGTITKWLVKVGDEVKRDQPLFEISTDKVDAEIPSPADGTVIEIKAAEGDTVPVNELVAFIGEAGEAAELPPAAEAPSEAPAEPAVAAAEPAAEPAEESAGDDDGLRHFASPVVKRIAAEEGIDLSQVTGSGSQGRVTKADLESYLEAREAGEVPAPPAPVPESAAPAPTPPPATARPSSGFSVPAYTASEEVEIVPMSKIRQITSAHMRYSVDTSAHVSSMFEIDLSRMVRVRNLAKAKFLRANGTKLTYMPFIFKAVASALKLHPDVNASIDGTNIVYKKHINLGMAVAMDRGLIVPVLRDADRLSVSGLARTANDLADRARNKRLKPDEVQGGTFTVTNPGVFGNLFGTPIINQPQVAILGIGSIEKRPVVTTDELGNDSISIRTRSYFGLSYDHRLVDGAEASHFMNDVKKVLEEDPWSELEPYL